MPSISSEGPSYLTQVPESGKFAHERGGIERKFSKSIDDSSLLGKILNKIVFLLSRLTDMNVAVIYGAEHLTKTNLGGSSFESTLPPLLSASVTMSKLNPESPGFNKLTNSLKFAEQLTNMSEFLPESHKAKTIQKAFTNLQPGEAIAIGVSKRVPGLDEEHAIMIELEKTSSGQCTLRVINTGCLSEKYHPVQCFANSAGDIKIQHHVVLEFKEVPASTLDQKMLLRLITTDDLTAFYEETLPQLQVAFSVYDPQQNPEYWARSQLGGSCPASAPLALARLHLSKSEFRDFKLELRGKMFAKFWSSLIHKLDPQSRKIISLEMIKKLESGYKKRGQGLPLPIKDITESLQTPAKSVPDLSQTHVSQRLHNAIKALKKQDFPTARKYIESLHEIKQLSASDVKEIMTVKNRLLDTVQELYSGSDYRLSFSTQEGTDLLIGLVSFLLWTPRDSSSDTKTNNEFLTFDHKLQGIGDFRSPFLMNKLASYCTTRDHPSPWTSKVVAHLQLPQLNEKFSKRLKLYQGKFTR